MGGLKLEGTEIVLPTLIEVATLNNVLVIAEPDILTIQVPPKPKSVSMLAYMKGLQQVFGWSITPTTYGFNIKATDLAKNIIIPRSSLTLETEAEFKGLGWEYMLFNNHYYVRAPEGAKIPFLKRPDRMRYTLKITQYAEEDLKDIGISIDILAKFQNDNISLLSIFTMADLLNGSAVEAESVNKFAFIGSAKLEKTAKAIKGHWTIVIDGTSISKAVWREELTRNVLIEARNIDDTRVSVDRQEIEGGRLFEVDPLGEGIFRVSIADLTISPNNDVSGISYKGDVDISAGFATWIYQGKFKQKKRGIFARGHEVKDSRYVVTLSVDKNPKQSTIQSNHLTPDINIKLNKKKL